jgi:hypothetical protein
MVVAMAVTVVEIVGMPTQFAIVTATIVTLRLPWCGAIVDPRLGSAHHGEVTNDLLCLLLASDARHKLEDIVHGHALFEARTAMGAEVFVKSHEQIIRPGGATVNSSFQSPSTLRMS